MTKEENIYLANISLQSMHTAVMYVTEYLKHFENNWKNTSYQV